MTEQLYDYDPACCGWQSEEAIAVVLADALETGDSAYVAKAFGVVAPCQEVWHGAKRPKGQGAKGRGSYLWRCGLRIWRFGRFRLGWLRYLQGD